MGVQESDFPEIIWVGNTKESDRIADVKWPLSFASIVLAQRPPRAARAWTVQTTTHGMLLVQDLDGSSRRLSIMPVGELFPIIEDLARSRQLHRERARSSNGCYLLLDACGRILLVDGCLPDGINETALVEAVRTLEVYPGCSPHGSNAGPGGVPVITELKVGGRILKVEIRTAPEKMVQVFCEDVTSLRQSQEAEKLKLAELEQTMRHDPLTGLLNRTGMMEGLSRQIAIHHRYSRQGALLFIDLDNFKAVNDMKGHAAGDDALKSVGRILRGLLRETDLASRTGGDEFLVWLNEIEKDQAILKAEEIQSRAAELHDEFGVPEKPLGFSIGVTMLDEINSADGLIAEADARMYEAKRGGKGRVVS